MADTAALVVALSAQLTKFEKDMKGAVDIANTRTKQIETSFTKMNAEINNQLSGIASGFSSRIGGLGSILGTLGPIGATVAIGLGAAVLAMNQLINTATEYAEKQRRLKEAAETTGLTINQFKVLGRAAAAVGVDADRFEGAINKMNAAIEELQQSASGKLFDALRKFPDLLTELSNAKEPAAAIEILARAVEGLDNQFDKSAFLRAAFGRGGFDVGRVLKSVFDASGIKNMEEAAAAAGKTVDKELVERIAQLKIEIDKAKKAQEEFIGKMVTEDTLQAQKQYLQFWDEIIRLIGEANQRLKEGESAGGALFRAIRNRIFGDTSGLSGITTGPTLAQAGKTSASEQAAAVAQFPGGAPLPTARPAAPPLEKTLEQRIRDINDMISALGGAARQSELFLQKELQLDKQLKENTITRTTYNRAIEQGRIEQAQAAEAVRERLAVASEEEIVQAKLQQARLDANRTDQASIDLTKAEILFRKQAKETIESQAAALSKLPESVRFSQQALDSFKQFDQLLVTTASSFENTFADIATSSKTASEAFKALADSIIRDLIRITIRMSVTGPLLKSLGGFFGAGGSAFPGGFDPTHGFNAAGTAFRQGGGPVRSGQPYIVGEHGPELFVPNSSGNVMPHNISRGGTGGAVVEINNFVAADTETKQRRETGPGNIDRVVVDIVKKASARGDLDDVNRGRFGLRPAKVR